MLRCDYLSFTFKPSRLPLAQYEELEKKLSFCGTFDEYFGLTDFEFFLEVFPEIKLHYKDFFTISSARHYRRRHSFNDCMYIYDDDGFDGVKGVNVEIPSHGLYLIKEWFDLDDNDFLRSFLSLIFRRGCTISRLDFCVDIPRNKCTVKPLDFYTWYIEHRLKTHYRNLECCGDPSSFLLKAIGDGTGGTTFYLGDRHSQILRVYDKYVESKGKIDAIRFEIEMHRKKANLVASAYIKNDFSFKALLCEMLDVLKYDSCICNRSRIPRDEIWEDFLSSCLTNECEGIYTPEKDSPPSIRSRIAWARKIYDTILALEFLSPQLKKELEMRRIGYVADAKTTALCEHLKCIGQYI